MTGTVDAAEQATNHVNTFSSPSDLRITDMRISTVVGAPMRCPLIKISTNPFTLWCSMEVQVYLPVTKVVLFH